MIPLRRENQDIMLFFERSGRKNEWEIHFGPYTEDGIRMTISQDSYVPIYLTEKDVKKILRKMELSAISLIPIAKKITFPLNSEEPFIEVRIAPHFTKVKIIISTRADKIAFQTNRPEDAYYFVPDKKFMTDFVVTKKAVLDFCKRTRKEMQSGTPTEQEEYKKFFFSFPDVQEGRVIIPRSKTTRKFFFNKKWQESLKLHQEKHNTSSISSLKRAIKILEAASESTFSSYERGAIFFTSFLYHIHEIPIENKEKYFKSFFEKEYTLELYLGKKYSMPYEIIKPELYSNPLVLKKTIEHSIEERKIARINWLKCSFNIIESTQKTYDAWEKQDEDIIKELKETFGVTISLFFMFFFCWVKGLNKDEKSIEWLVENLSDETIKMIYDRDLKYHERLKKEWELENRSNPLSRLTKYFKR